MCRAAYTLSRLCAEPLLMWPLMCWTAYVPSRLSTESAYVRTSYVLSRLFAEPFHRDAYVLGRLCALMRRIAYPKLG